MRGAGRCMRFIAHAPPRRGRPLWPRRCAHLHGHVGHAQAVSNLIHLSKYGATVKVFAPNDAQREVVDHTKSSSVLAPPLSVRNMMVEAARISRGDIQPLADLNVEEFDAVIFPGGFGVAKNLCVICAAHDGACPLTVRSPARRRHAGPPLPLQAPPWRCASMCRMC